MLPVGSCHSVAASSQRMSDEDARDERPQAESCCRWDTPCRWFRCQRQSDGSYSVQHLHRKLVSEFVTIACIIVRSARRRVRIDQGFGFRCADLRLCFDDRLTDLLDTISNLTCVLSRTHVTKRTVA